MKTNELKDATIARLRADMQDIVDGNYPPDTVAAEICKEALAATEEQNVAYIEAEVWRNAADQVELWGYASEAKRMREIADQHEKGKA
jgi:hypothetical protein